MELLGVATGPRLGVAALVIGAETRSVVAHRATHAVGCPNRLNDYSGKRHACKSLASFGNFLCILLLTSVDAVFGAWLDVATIRLQHRIYEKELLDGDLIPLG